MTQAVIVSTARTPIGKAYRGAFNNTQSQELADLDRHAWRSSAPAWASAADRGRHPRRRRPAGRPGRQRRASGRHARGDDVLWQACPWTVSARPGHGDRDGRQADRPRRHEGRGGRRRRSRSRSSRRCRRRTPSARKDRGWWRTSRRSTRPTLHTAEVVSSATACPVRRRTRSPSSQQRTAAAQEAGRFDAEIVPLTFQMRSSSARRRGRPARSRRPSRRTRQPPLDDAGEPPGPQPGAGAGRRIEGPDRCMVAVLPPAAVRRGLGIRAHERGGGGEARSAAAGGHLQGHRRCGGTPRRRWGWLDLRRPAPAGAPRPYGCRRHRPVELNEAFGGPGPVLPAPTSWASTRRSTTSTAAGSPWATPTA